MGNSLGLLGDAVAMVVDVVTVRALTLVASIDV